MRSRKRSDQTADIEQGHISSALCHLGNVSHRLGQLTAPDELQAAVKNDSAAQETLARMEEHLAANGMDIKQTRLTLGPTLMLDPKTERFTGGPLLEFANDMLTRTYRPGFVVPAKL